MKEAGGDEELDLNLVDKHEEDWIKPAYVAFSNGNTLGSAVVSEDSFVLDPDIVSTFPTAPEPVDDSQPHTTVQVRTLTGQRLKIKYDFFL